MESLNATPQKGLRGALDDACQLAASSCEKVKLKRFESQGMLGLPPTATAATPLNATSYSGPHDQPEGSPHLVNLDPAASLASIGALPPWPSPTPTPRSGWSKERPPPR